MAHPASAPQPFEFRFADDLTTRPAGAGALRVAQPVKAGESGAPLLFIPGAYHGAWSYSAWLSACHTRGITCAALDYRGHGALAKRGLSVTANVADYASDTLAAIRSFGTPPVLVGHSLGGLVAMAAATQAPLAGLALVAPSPPGNLAGAKALAAIDESCLRQPPERAEVLERFLGGEDGGLLEACMARLCPESPRALNERYRLSVAIDAARVRAPVLVIEAGLDCGERHPAGQDEAIARFFGGAFIHIQQAPHCMMLGQASQESLDALLRWRAALP